MITKNQTLSLLHITKWASNYENLGGWYLNYPHDGDVSRGIPEHPMEFWTGNGQYITYVARLGDDVAYTDLPIDLKSSSIEQYFGAQVSVPEGGTVVCGSIGEVANDPALKEVFDISSSGRVRRTGMAEPDNQKQVVWTEVSLSAKDQLRQRMAHALTSIIPIVHGDIDDNYKNEMFVNFHDILVRNAFGEYIDILREVSYSQLMAQQLSYLGSKSHAYVYQTADKRISVADENYAR